MRVLPAIEEDQLTGARPDNRAGPFHRIDIGRTTVMRENKLTTRAFGVIGAEEQTGQRVGVDMTLEPHRYSALDIHNQAVTIVAGRADLFRAQASG
jgi:hypothetical protein